jgi:thiamine biosynthesis lipoprotein
MVLAPPDVVASVTERVQKSARTEVRGDYYQLSFKAMNTNCRVNFRAATPALAQDCQAEAVQWTAAFEARYSRFIPQSIIGQINAAAGRDWVEVDQETEGLFAFCQEMVFFTRGVFDPATLPLIQLWNWKASPPQIPDATAIAAARELSGWHKVQRRPGAVFLPRAGMGLDLGGIGKEYAVDQVLEKARQRGLLDVLVDFGQDVRAYGQSPGKGAWHIGLEDPKQPGRCWSCVAVTNQAVATSGDYFRAFTSNGRRYGHILDPRNGEPVMNDCLAVTVIAATCTMAGLLSTSAFVLGPREGLELVQRCQGAEACITAQNSRYQTSNFSAYVLN